MEITQFPKKTYLGIVTKDAGMDQMKEIFNGGYASIGEYVGKNGVQVVGPPVGLYSNHDMEKNTMTTIPAFEVAPGTTVADDKFSIIEIEESKTLHYQHVGSYDGLKDAHNAMMKKMEEDKLQMGQQAYAIEVYLTDPMEELDESKWVTDIYYQLD